jgi:hypothetical protein
LARVLSSREENSTQSSFTFLTFPLLLSSAESKLQMKALNSMKFLENLSDLGIRVEHLKAPDDPGYYSREGLSKNQQKKEY